MKQKTYAFSQKALNTATPTWAKNVFRVTMLLTTAIAAWVAASEMVEQTWKMEIILILKCLDPVIWGLSKMFGVEPPDQEN